MTKNDEIELKSYSNIEIYVTYVLLGVLRGLKVNDGNGINYDEEFRKVYKFENLGEDKRMRSYIDLIEDTELAIKAFYKDGLSTGNDGYFSLDESYLRLYGVLNSVYLQKEAVISFVELFKIRNKKKIVADFNSLKILDVRNKLGAHTANYLYEKGSSKTTSFKLVRISMSKWGNRLLIINDMGGSEEINLIEILSQFNKMSEVVLKLVCEKAIKSLFPNKFEFRVSFEYASTRIYNYQFDKI